MRRAFIVRGGWDGHEPVQVSDIFKGILEDAGFEVTVSDTLEAFADAEELKKYSLIVPHWTMGKIPGEYAKNVSEAVASGVGMAGCHGGMCDAFRENTLWQFMTGSQFVDHPGGDGTKYKVYIKKSSDSPIVRGLEDFEVASEQYYIHYDPAVNVLATVRFPVVNGPHASNGAVDIPAMYTKMWGKGKIFYCTLGHVASLFDDNLKLIMKRGFEYAARED